MVTNLTRDDQEWGTTIRWRNEDGKTRYFTGFDYEECKRRALVFNALVDRFEFDVPRSGTVPIEIALAGRPAIASFLFSVRQEPVADIAEGMDVSEQTVRQYLSDICHGRR